MARDPSVMIANKVHVQKLAHFHAHGLSIPSSLAHIAPAFPAAPPSASRQIVPATVETSSPSVDRTQLSQQEQVAICCSGTNIHARVSLKFGTLFPKQFVFTL